MSLPEGQYPVTTAHDGAARARVAIVAARYHAEIVDPLVEGARGHFLASGGLAEDLTVHEAPGTFELPLMAQALAALESIDAVVCVGCVLTGETSHDRYICDAAAHGLMRVSLDFGKPVAFGVLTCQTMAQARARAGGDRGNKGEEAMAAALAMLRTLKGMTS
ncbi:MAG: 6,7-dimethyl-8-ribityllumazine synthase [Planctomycetota bacterium]|nr:6,7-dimethyl-8-ribityllumazine synthase [Planctomycetota bacterium]